MTLTTTSSWPAEAETLAMIEEALTGLPLEYREEPSARGFSLLRGAANERTAARRQGCVGAGREYRARHFLRDDLRGIRMQARQASGDARPREAAVRRSVKYGTIPILRVVDRRDLDARDALWLRARRRDPTD